MFSLYNYITKTKGPRFSHLLPKLNPTCHLFVIMIDLMWFE